MFKLILSLANKDIELSKKITSCYLDYDIDMIDCSIEVYSELAEFINKNLPSNKTKPKLCISAALADDAHSKKAKINKNCKKCSKCASICSQNAIYETESTYRVDYKRCVGCSYCKKVCKADAIDIYKVNNFKSDIIKIKELGLKPDYLELHLSVKKKKEIIENFIFALENYKGNISICLSRKYMGTNKILKVIKELKEIFDKICPDYDFMLQLDGASINNANDENSSNLEALAFYKELANLDYKIVISGGLNSKTVELCKLFNLKPYGLAYGTYARKLVENKQKLDELMKEIKEFYR